MNKHSGSLSARLKRVADVTERKESVIVFVSFSDKQRNNPHIDALFLVSFPYLLCLHYGEALLYQVQKGHVY